MRTILKLVFTCALSLAPMSASSIQFVQDGWETGAILSVAFSGEDTDADGAITLPELTAFSALWGTSPANSTSWTLLNIQPDGFIFADLGNYLFFATNPDFSIVSSAFEGEALASVFDSSLFPVDSSATPPSAVPEPTGLGAAGLLLIGVALWRRPTQTHSS